MNLLVVDPPQIRTPSTEDWQERAECVIRVGPAFWDELTDHTLGAAQEDIAYARRVCSACPLRDACLERALRLERARKTHVGRYGIWGGLDGAERAALAAFRNDVGRD